MMIKRGRKGKGKKSAILIIEEDDIVANGPMGRRVQNGLEDEVELQRRQLQALTAIEKRYDDTTTIEPT